MARLLGALLVVATGALAGYPSVDESQVQELLRQMTTEEKFLQTCIDSECPESRARWLRCNPFGGGGTEGGGDAWFNLRDNTRLGIRGMRMRDGPKGMTCAGGGVNSFGPPCPEGGRSPSFPSQITRAASWDVELEEEIGRAIAEVADQLDVHAALLPTINILPWLNWGRAQETYGEDPFFSGKMGAGIVRGVQHDQKVMATVKHFLANNIENTRWWVSAEFDDKTLHDVYLKAWAIVVAEASPELVMTSYNRIQGKYAFADPKFISILRDVLGFDGSVMTDWFASWEAITSGMILLELGASSPFFMAKHFLQSNSLYTAGVDMEMPFCSKNRDAVSQLQGCAVDAEQACDTRSHLDQATERLLRTKSRYGLLGVSKNHTHRVSWDNERYDELILKSAHRGIVLLKNDNVFLPKEPSAVASVAVVGSAEVLELGDNGSSAVQPSGRHVNVFEGLQNRYGLDKVTMIREKSPENTVIIQNADLVVVDVGYASWFEGEFLPPNTGGDRRYLNLHSWDRELIQTVSDLNPNVVVAITAGASVIVEEFVDKVKGILWMGYPGPLGGQALADILAGHVNPSGRMPSVTPRQPEDYLPEGINLEPWVLETADPAPAYPYSHGFKHMWEKGISPRYPFGWGLSYSTFEHSQPRVSLDSGGNLLKVEVEVKNTGAVAGLETVQVYASCKACSNKRLPILLVAFAKVQLAASEQRSLELVVAVKELAAYDIEASSWLLEKGTYDIWVGPAADAALLKSASVAFESDRTFSYPGKPWATQRDSARRKDCPSNCTPALESERIKAWALPTSLSWDVFMLLIWAKLYWKTSCAIAVVVFGALTALFCRCICRCCRKVKQEKEKKT